MTRASITKGYRDTAKPVHTLPRAPFPVPGEGVFVIADERVRAGRLLDAHHQAEALSASYASSLCQVCNFGVRPASRHFPAKHMPMGAGVERVQKWIEEHPCSTK